MVSERLKTVVAFVVVSRGHSYCSLPWRTRSYFWIKCFIQFQNGGTEISVPSFSFLLQFLALHGILIY